MSRTPLTRPSADQIIGTYKRMALEARYRPAAPSDGFGNITADESQLDLDQEALEYAFAWWEEEDDGSYNIGIPDYRYRPSIILAVEAAKIMCGGGSDAKPFAVRMLELALEEAKAAE